MSSSPLMIEYVPGYMLIDVFERLLLEYKIEPVFVNKVIRRDDTFTLDGYFAFYEERRVDIEFILYSMRAALKVDVYTSDYLCKKRKLCAV